MRSATIILRQLLSLVSMVLVLKKDLGFFVSIISSKVPFKVGLSRLRKFLPN